MTRVMRYGFLFAAVACVVATVWAMTIPTPAATSENGMIAVRWTTDDETGLARFDVLRRAGHQGDFVTIGTMQAKGYPSSYTYWDRSVFKIDDGVYEYKIRLVLTQGSTLETSIAEAKFLSSTAKRTWGSIKAMFR